MWTPTRTAKLEAVRDDLGINVPIWWPLLDIDEDSPRPRLEQRVRPVLTTPSRIAEKRQPWSIDVAELGRVQSCYVNRPNSGEFGYRDPLRRFPPGHKNMILGVLE